MKKSCQGEELFHLQINFLKVAIPMGWILILLLCVTHISIILSNVQALHNNRAVTILTFRWSSSVLTVMNQPYLQSSEKSQSYALTIRINQLSIMNGP